ERSVLHEPDSGGVPLVLPLVGFQRRRLLDIDNVRERAARRRHPCRHADDSRAVHGAAWGVLLVVPRAEQREAGHHEAEVRAAAASDPAAFVTHDFTILVYVDVLAKIEDGVGALA